MEAKRIVQIRKVLEATTAPPDVCTMGHGIFIVSGSTPKEVQDDARFYRQAWGFVKELLDEVDQLQAACHFALTAAERCQDERNNGCGPDAWTNPGPPVRKPTEDELAATFKGNNWADLLAVKGVSGSMDG